MEESPVSDQAHTGSIPQKRPRPVLSCLECRRKKLKCDRLLPCQQCQKSHLSCAYSDGQEVPPRTEVEYGRDHDHVPTLKKPRLAFGSSRDLSDVPHPEMAATAKVGIMEDLQVRVSRLENALSSKPLQHAGDVRENRLSSAPTAEEKRLLLSRSYVDGTRGRIIYQFEEARAFMSAIQQPNADPAVLSIGHELQSLYGALKPFKPRLQRNLTISLQEEMLGLLPEKIVCDELVDIYFENYEHCIRIMHRPTFLAEYWSFCSSREPNGLGDDANKTYSVDFVPRLLALLLVAVSSGLRPICRQSSLYDESGHFPAIESLQQWLDELKPKHRKTLKILQIRTLILLLKKSRNIRKDDSWNYSGSVVRHAMTADLHIEPNSAVNVFEAEQRRRLWASVIELDLAISISCEMPSALLPEDYTCQRPININDDDLQSDMPEMPLSRSSEEWTDTICLSTLAGSLGARLEAYRLLTRKTGDLRYDDVLTHTRRIERVLQTLPPPLRFSSISHGNIHKPAHLNATVAFDVTLRRALLALYTPFALAAPPDDFYREARIGHIQSCLIPLCYQDLFDPKFSELNVPEPEAYWDLFYRDYEHDIMQVALGLCLETKRVVNLHKIPGILHPTAVDEASPLAKIPETSKSTLIKSIDETIEPMVRRIGRSGSNLKDLACLAIVFHSIRTNDTAEMKKTLVIEGLRELISDCRRYLERNGVVVRDSTASNNSGGSKALNHIGSEYTTPDFGLLFDELLDGELDFEKGLEDWNGI